MKTDYTFLLARIIGPVLIVAGVMLISQPARMLAGLTGFILDDALFMLGGFVTLILGLGLVTVHQRFDSISAGIISVLAWVLTARGIVILLAPELVRNAADFIHNQPRFLPVAGLTTALVGVWLTYAGYIAGTLRVDTSR